MIDSMNEVGVLARPLPNVIVVGGGNLRALGIATLKERRLSYAA